MYFLYSALLGTPGHIGFYQAVRTVGPGRAAVFMNLIPFLVLGLSWLMLGETIRWYRENEWWWSKIKHHTEEFADWRERWYGDRA